jgi:uncharacterized protein (TIGR02266 family)
MMMQQPSIVTVPPTSPNDSAEPVLFRLKLDCDSVDEFIDRYKADVSRGGIVIRTMKPLAVGTRVKLDLQLRNGAPLISGDGKVVWTREPDAGSGPFPGMGIRLGKLTRPSQDVINQTLSYKDLERSSSASRSQPFFDRSESAELLANAGPEEQTPTVAITPPPEARTLSSSSANGATHKAFSPAGLRRTLSPVPKLGADQAPAVPAVTPAQARPAAVSVPASPAAAAAKRPLPATVPSVAMTLIGSAPPPVMNTTQRQAAQAATLAAPPPVAPAHGKDRSAPVVAPPAPATAASKSGAVPIPALPPATATATAAPAAAETANPSPAHASRTRMFAIAGGVGALVVAAVLVLVLKGGSSPAPLASQPAGDPARTRPTITQVPSAPNPAAPAADKSDDGTAAAAATAMPPTSPAAEPAPSATPEPAAVAAPAVTAAAPVADDADDRKSKGGRTLALRRDSKSDRGKNGASSRSSSGSTHRAAAADQTDESSPRETPPTPSGGSSGRVESPAPAPAPAPSSATAAAQPAARVTPPAEVTPRPFEPGAPSHKLRLTSIPSDAEVVLDGKVIGRTPLLYTEIDVSRSHALLIRKEGFAPYQQTISATSEWNTKGSVATLKISALLNKGDAK